MLLLKHDPAIAILLGLVTAAIAALLVLFVALTWQAIRKHQSAPVLSPIENKAGTEWTLREAFMHVDSDVLDDVSLREPVGKEIADRCSTGQLKSCGRLIGRDTRRRQSLAEIPKEDWREVKFTYWFLDNPDGQSLDFESILPGRGAAPREYADVHVSKEDALKIWPTPSRISLREAARIAYERTRKTRMAQSAGITSAAISKYYAKHIFRHSIVYGEKAPSTILEVIPDNIKQRLSLSDDLSQVSPLLYNSDPTFIDIVIKRDDLEDFIQWVERMSEAKI